MLMFPGFFFCALIIPSFGLLLQQRVHGILHVEFCTLCPDKLIYIPKSGATINENHSEFLSSNRYSTWLEMLGGEFS